MIKQRDIPDNFLMASYQNASISSDQSAAADAIMFVAPANLTLASAWWTPLGADQGATAHVSSEYRTIQIINVSTGGAGTAIMASLALSASKVSLAPVAITTVGTATNSASKGDAILFSHVTSGAADAVGTVLRAGRVIIAYRLL